MGYIVPIPPLPPPELMRRMSQKFIFNRYQEILYTYKKHYWPIIIRWLIRAKPDIVNVIGCKDCKYLKDNGSGYSYKCKKTNVTIQNWERDTETILKECPFLPPKIKATLALGKI